MTFTQRLNKLYDTLCGSPPYLYPWHFQFLSIVYLRLDIMQSFTNIGGKVLDFGCGDKPYKRYTSSATTDYIGVDTVMGAVVDTVVSPDNTVFPFPDGYFNWVVATQSMEHVMDPSACLREIHRVLKPGGKIIVTVPFIYQQHHPVHDYWRFTTNGIAKTLSQSGFEVIETRTQGKLPSTLSSLFLAGLLSNKPTKAILFAGLPLFLLATLCLNILAIIADYIWPSDRYYANVLVVAKVVK